MDLVLFAPRYIQFCLGRDFDADLEVARAAVPGAARRPQGARARRREPHGHAARHASLRGVRQALRLRAADDLGVEAAVNAILEDVLETDHGVKNALDHFLEMLGVMAVQETSSTRSTTCSRTGTSPSTSRAPTTPSARTASASTTRARWWT